MPQGLARRTWLDYDRHETRLHETARPQTMRFPMLRIGAVLAAFSLTLAVPAPAQQMASLGAGMAGLDLPEIRVLGRFDPNVRRATAIVNGDIITDTDVEQRLALVMIANQGAQMSDQEREILRLQVLRNLIDEKLQIQEAAEHDVRVPEAEVEQAYARVAANFRQSPEEFSAFLRASGSSPVSIKQQIRGELAWGRLLRKRVEPFVNVGDDEVAAIIRRLEESRGQTEYRVGEILLSATEEALPQALADARRIVDQIRQGASFVAYARQFSEASTAAVGGDLGWVRLEQLSPALAPVISALPRGAVSDPVVVPGGVAIVALVDQRQVLSADPGEAILSLKQLSIPLPETMTEAQARRLAADVQARTQAMGGCGRVEDVARDLGAEVVTNDQVRMRDLPGPLQEIMRVMPVGGATPPFGSQADGLRVLVLCGRDDAPVQARMPSADEIYSQLADQRVNSAARRYLRDLRRDAVVEYR